MSSLLLGGIGELISLYRLHALGFKTETKNLTSSVTSLQMKEVKVQHQHEKLLWLYISIGGVLEFLLTNSFNIIDFEIVEWSGINLQSQVRMIQILFTSIFSYLFLEKQIPPRHRVISMIIVFIGLIMVNLPYMKIAFNNEGTEKPYVIALLGYFFIAGAQEVLNKIIMISKYVSPYKLLFFEGAISMGLQIIALIIISFVNGLFKEKTYEEFLQQMTGWLGISLFAFWICEFGLNLSVTLTNFIIPQLIEVSVIVLPVY